MGHVPKAIRIRENIKHRILNGEFGHPGDKFPTVRALARDLSVSLVTSHRIITTLREDGYIEHRGRRHVLSSVSAKSESLASPRLFGLIVADLENPFFTRLVRDVELWAKKKHLTLMLGNSHYNIEVEYGLVNQFVSAGVQGILAAPCCESSTRKNSYEGLDVPTVFLGRKPDGLSNPDAVLARNYAGGVIVAQHLLSLGKRAFGYMGQAVFKYDPRLDGFRAGLSEAGTRLPPKHVMHSPDATPESAMKTFQAHWTRTRVPAAVFCYHDLLAVGMIRACHAMGLAIPEDVAIVGFDDLPIARDIHPSLTTMRYPIHEMARLAVDCMLDKLRDKDHESSTVCVEPELIVRQSTDVSATKQDTHPHANPLLAYLAT